MDSNTLIDVRQASEGRLELELRGDVNVFLASQLHEEAVRLAESGQDVLVDCEQVESVDASALQILVALQEALAAHGRTVQFRGGSEQWIRTIRSTGLSSRFGCEDAEPRPEVVETTVHGEV
jgi:anti-anti-sigma factor